MGDVIDFVLAPAKAILGIDGGPPDVVAPSARETEAQTEQEALLTAREKLQRDEARGRQRIITARSAGPQTLLTRPDQIPKPVKLGGA